MMAAHPPLHRQQGTRRAGVCACVGAAHTVTARGCRAGAASASGVRRRPAADGWPLRGAQAVPGAHQLAPYSFWKRDKLLFSPAD